jgi:hypothetical protein
MTNPARAGVTPLTSIAPVFQPIVTGTITVCLMGQPSQIPIDIAVTLDGVPMSPQVTGCWSVVGLDPTVPHQVSITGTGIVPQSSSVYAVGGTVQLVQLPLVTASPLAMSVFGIPLTTLAIGAAVAVALILVFPAPSATKRNPSRRRRRR